MYKETTCDLKSSRQNEAVLNSSQNQNRWANIRDNVESNSTLSAPLDRNHERKGNNFITNRPSSAAARAKSQKEYAIREFMKGKGGYRNMNLSDLINDSTRTTNLTPTSSGYSAKSKPNNPPQTLTSGLQPKSPRRPSSAPSRRFGSSPHSRPRYNTSKFTCSGKSKNPFARGTGRIDPYNNVMMHRYKVANKNTTTNHEQYGLFVKNLNKVLRYQR